MAYQCTQPSLPPPMCVSSCCTTSADCGSPTSMPYQMKQPSGPPPICTQPCLAECTNPPAPTFAPLCSAVMPDPGSAASVEVVSSSSGSPHAERPCPPSPVVTHPYAAEIVNADMTGRASYPESTRAFVAPGSVVSLHPCGSIVVRPGPEEGASVSVEATVPHFS